MRAGVSKHGATVEIKDPWYNAPIASADRKTPMTIDLSKAIALRRQGHLAEAAPVYEAALRRSPLYGTPRRVRDVERAYEEMWSIHCRGEAPREIVLA